MSKHTAFHPKGILVYTVHKAGSMFLHDICGELAAHLELGHSSLNYPEQLESIRQQSWRTHIELNPLNHVFGPIRSREAMPILPASFDSYETVVHIRDPRDVLTSLYFSHAYSHDLKSAKLTAHDRDRIQCAGVDAYVLERLQGVVSIYDYLIENLPWRQTLIVKYEEMVTDFSKWLGDFLPPFRRISGLDDQAERELFNVFCKKYADEFCPGEEDVYRHKRKVTPGDHREKLRPETIGVITDALERPLRFFGYI